MMNDRVDQMTHHPLSFLHRRSFVFGIVSFSKYNLHAAAA